MQPLAGMSTINNVVTLRRGAGVESGEVNVNAQEFWRKKVENVPVDQVRNVQSFCCRGGGKQKAFVFPTLPYTIHPWHL